MWHFQVSKVLQKCERDLLALPYSLTLPPRELCGAVQLCWMGNLPRNDGVTWGLG